MDKPSLARKGHENNSLVRRAVSRFPEENRNEFLLQPSDGGPCMVSFAVP